jgi:hypothetical protein
VTDRAGDTTALPHRSESGSAPRFVDVAAAAGIDYRWELAPKRPLNILQTIGNGCAFLDYDNSGNLSILLVGPKLALYKGDGHGHFIDVTHQTGLDRFHDDFMGCAVGDYDNDGFEDIYISAYGGGLLLHNEHGKSFKNVTALAGIKPQPWATSCSFADLDNDGRLDLYIDNYVVFGPNTVPQLCKINGVLTSCAPHYYKPLKGVVYKNLGGGKFKDVTAAWGAQDVAGNALGVAAADFDGSGRQSLVVANDGLRADLLTLQGRRYQNTGAKSGVGYSAQGNPQSEMGIDWGDYNNDGKLDLAVATYADEIKPVYRQVGAGLFDDQSTALGLGEQALPNLAFGVKWLDYDNDGWLDLMFSNGHIADNIADYQPGHSFLQPTLLFENDKGQHFSNVTALAGTALQKKIMGRGLAIGDFDNDGRMDALIVDNSAGPLLLHNETTPVGHWLEVSLVGTKSNRDGIGALITADTGNLRLTRLCHTDGSYMSASDKRVHIGLGPAATVPTLTVRWPSGHVDIYHDVAADRIVTIKEGASGIQVRTQNE